MKLNEAMATLAKTASIFLIGSVAGGVFVFNAYKLDTQPNYATSTNHGLVDTVDSQEVIAPVEPTPIEEVKNTHKLSEVENTVVSLNVTLKQTDSIFSELFRDTQPKASGSGVIYSEDDNGVYIITNNHVVEGSESIEVTVADEDEPINAKLIGRDPSIDIAVIYVDKKELEESSEGKYLLSFIGDSDELKMFDEVYAIGNAAGEGKSGTKGTVSALDKKIPVDDGRGSEINAIQIDAPINPGNSGGALVNEDGQLIGINFAKVVAKELEGIGYSIPVNDVVTVANEIIERGNTDTPIVLGVESRPIMGVIVISITEEDARDIGIFYDHDVVMIVSVGENSPAEKAGIKKGDIILALNDKKITSKEELTEEISNFEIGEEIELTISRDNETIKVKLVLADSALFAE